LQVYCPLATRVPGARDELVQTSLAVGRGRRSPSKLRRRKHLLGGPVWSLSNTCFALLLGGAEVKAWYHSKHSSTAASTDIHRDKFSACIYLHILAAKWAGSAPKRAREAPVCGFWRTYIETWRNSTIGVQRM